MKTKKMSTSLILLIVIIAIVLFFFARKEQALKEESVQWLSVEGTVASSQVRRAFEKKGGSSETNFIFELHYNYEVQGQTYAGNRYKFHGDPVFKSKKDAEELVADYPPGKKITVYYQPDDPQQAVIIR